MRDEPMRCVVGTSTLAAAVIATQVVYLTYYLATPWLSEGSEDHEWGSVVWHKSCDQRFAPVGSVGEEQPHE